MIVGSIRGGLGAAGESDCAVRQTLMGETRGMGQPVMVWAQQDAVFQVCSTTE